MLQGFLGRVPSVHGSFPARDLAEAPRKTQWPRGYEGGVSLLSVIRVYIKACHPLGVNEPRITFHGRSREPSTGWLPSAGLGAATRPPVQVGERVGQPR